PEGTGTPPPLPEVTEVSPARVATSVAPLESTVTRYSVCRLVTLTLGVMRVKSSGAASAPGFVTWTRTWPGLPTCSRSETLPDGSRQYDEIATVELPFTTTSTLELGPKGKWSLTE